MVVGGSVTISSKTVARRFSVFVSALILLCGVLLNRSAYAQQGLVINLTAAAPATENSPVEVKADVKSLTSISQALLFYRDNLSTDFQQTEMSFDESSMALKGTVPAGYVVSPYIEVYVRLIMRDGSSETYPSISPTENPVRISVSAAESQRDIIIISPERNQRVTIDNLLIAASMLYAPVAVDKKKTKVYFDGKDVTSDAVLSGAVIVYSPIKYPLPIRTGIHTARIVLFNSDGAEYKSLEWSFFVVAPGAEKTGPEFTYQGTGKIELRNETLGGVSTWYNRGDVNLGGNAFGVNLGANVHITSEEKSYRQPQDRFGLYASTSWLTLKLGDSYPAFSPLIMNGLRVRGISGRMSLGFFNLEAAYGQTVRGIGGQYLDTVVASPGSPMQLTASNYIRLNDSTFVGVNYGTFSRDLFAIRPSFDLGSHARLGFTYLKSSDIASSINLGHDPNQNLVLGSDLSMNFDNRRINFVAEAAMSMLNQNTAVGNRSASYIDSVTQSNAGTQINDIVPLSTLSQLITINEFLVPLDPGKLSSLSYDASLSFNYFNSLAKVGYVYRGPDYTSFGQPFIRTDIRGLNFFLQPRLYSNQILLTISYENLFDNLQHNKFATTNYVNSNVSVSYFPIKSLPSVTLGFSSYADSNPLSLDSVYAVDNTTYRYYVESNYAFNYLVRQNLAVSFAISNRKDRVLLGTNLNNFNLSFMLNSDFGSMPLRTTVGFNVNGNKTSSRTLDSTMAMTPLEQVQTFNYTFLILGARYGFLANKLSLGFNFTPYFGAFVRNGFSLTGSYRVARSQSINLYVNYYSVSGSSDLIGSLMYTVDF